MVGSIGVIDIPCSCRSRNEPEISIRKAIGRSTAIFNATSSNDADRFWRFYSGLLIGWLLTFLGPNVMPSMSRSTGADRRLLASDYWFVLWNFFQHGKRSPGSDPYVARIIFNRKNMKMFITPSCQNIYDNRVRFRYLLQQCLVFLKICQLLESG